MSLIGLVVVGLAHSYEMILVGATLIGIGSSIFHPEASRLARLSSGGRFGFAQSVFPGDTMVMRGTVEEVSTDDAGCGWVSLLVSLTVDDDLELVSSAPAPPVVTVMVVHEPGTWFDEVLSSVAAQDYPNLRNLFILTDDQGYGDLSCNGNPILKTPHIDRLHDEAKLEACMFAFPDFEHDIDLFQQHIHPRLASRKGRMGGPR